MNRTPRTISAAGGVVWRMRDGAPELLVIHRARYGDWTLPKGKLEAGEPELLAAVREVHEEVGAHVAVQQQIRTVKYTVDDARKRVRYWSMRWIDGGFTPNDEVDDAIWLRVGRAYRRLSYAPDRAVLSDFAASPVADSMIVLVRHAKAGKRSDWGDDDQLRPLDPNGTKQARALAQLLAVYAPTRILSADRTRCVETVQPLADALGIPVEIAPAFADAKYDDGPDGTHTSLLALAKPGEVSVVCSQGVTIPGVIERLGTGLRATETRKAGWWALSVVDGDVIATDPYDPPSV